MSGDEHLLAEISVEPAAAGEEHHHAIRQAIQALSGPNLVVTVGAMSTTVEGPLDDVLAAVARAHRSADIRANRVITAMRIESRQGGLHLRDRIRAEARGWTAAPVATARIRRSHRVVWHGLTHVPIVQRMRITFLGTGASGGTGSCHAESGRRAPRSSADGLATDS